jgi:Flp pilus assembly pilin Flp
MKKAYLSLKKISQVGQIAAEYLLVLALVSIALINGNPSPMEEFFDAIKRSYGAFTYAVATPYISAVPAVPVPYTGAPATIRSGNGSTTTPPTVLEPYVPPPIHNGDGA